MYKFRDILKYYCRTDVIYFFNIAYRDGRTVLGRGKQLVYSDAYDK